jgi:hypothetical protein
MHPESMATPSSAMTSRRAGEPLRWIFRCWSLFMSVILFEWFVFTIAQIRALVAGLMTLRNNDQ